MKSGGNGVSFLQHRCESSDDGVITVNFSWREKCSAGVMVVKEETSFEFVVKVLSCYRARVLRARNAEESFAKVGFVLRVARNGAEIYVELNNLLKQFKGETAGVTNCKQQSLSEVPRGGQRHILTREMIFLDTPNGWALAIVFVAASLMSEKEVLLAYSIWMCLFVRMHGIMNQESRSMIVSRR
ncbi:hypothetical protein CDAR_496371 [Caerostris darwini]|uniref:Uncharacterized protein n=1 Tax=Caerostris darwini TaxID=1538125 RepID=A0AAV4X223_9ARAC|nr:hypothetical protein CDAR_496371 [Caerostris darwini]